MTGELHDPKPPASAQAERLRTILDSALVGIVTVGAHGIEWMNRSARRMLGGPLADFLHQPIAMVATEEPDHPLRQSQYRMELADGETRNFECRIRAVDGREFWVVGNAVVTAGEDAQRQLTYALMDVDARRRAETRVASAQASLQRIIEAAPLAILVFDAASLVLVQINAVAAQLTRWPAPACIGLGPVALFDADTAAQMLADMRTALAGAGVMQRDLRIARGGEARLWDARYTPLAVDASEPGAGSGQLLLVATDVTEQRAAEQARLAAAVAQREMLIQEVHHRIKNNLQGVAGLLQQTAQRRPELADILGGVVGQVHAIADVYGLRVGRGARLHIAELLASIAGSIERLFGHRVVLHEMDSGTVPWSLPEAQAPALALSLNELLTNAVKHSSRAAGQSAEAVTCTLGCHDGAAQVVIANRGCLPPGFDLAWHSGGVSGLGLVQSLLPQRSATLSIEQQGERVLARLVLLPPGTSREAAGASAARALEN